MKSISTYGNDQIEPLQNLKKLGVLGSSNVLGSLGSNTRPHSGQRCSARFERSYLQDRQRMELFYDNLAIVRINLGACGALASRNRACRQ